MEDNYTRNKPLSLGNKEENRGETAVYRILSTITMLITVDNCGKIIEKKWKINLAILQTRIIRQHFGTAKKVSSFFIMIFQNHFSQILDNYSKLIY